MMMIVPRRASSFWRIQLIVVVSAALRFNIVHGFLQQPPTRTIVRLRSIAGTVRYVELPVMVSEGVKIIIACTGLYLIDVLFLSVPAAYTYHSSSAAAAFSSSSSSSS